MNLSSTVFYQTESSNNITWHLIISQNTLNTFSDDKLIAQKTIERKETRPFIELYI